LLRLELIAAQTGAPVTGLLLAVRFRMLPP
jgi:hypothetical protein